MGSTDPLEVGRSGINLHMQATRNSSKRPRTSLTEVEFDRFSQNMSTTGSDMETDDADVNGTAATDRELLVNKTTGNVNTAIVLKAASEECDHVSTANINIGEIDISQDKESYTVSNSTLKKNLPGNNDTPHRFVRFSNDKVGTAKILLSLLPAHSTTTKGRNRIKIWMIISSLQIVPTSLEMTNHFSAEVMFDDFRDANRALDVLDAIKEPKLKAHVDQRSIICRGVITDWPASIPELWPVIQNKERIIKLDRMYRRNWDAATKKTTLVPTDNIIVTFKADKICDLSIFTNGVSLRVRPYVSQTRQCYNCFRYGHTKNACKSETRCIVCGDKSHGQCDRPVCCSNCKGQHKSTFRGCPVHEKNRSISIVMAHKNVSFYRARRIVEGEDPPLEFRDKFTAPAAWPDLPTRAVPSEDRPVTSRMRDRGDRPRGSPPSVLKIRNPIVDSTNNYYGRFDNRAGEVTRERRGLALTSHNGTSWAQVARGMRTSDDGGLTPSPESIEEIIGGVIRLLQRFPAARDILIDSLIHSERAVYPAPRENREARLLEGREGRGGDNGRQYSGDRVYRHPREAMTRQDLRPIFRSLNNDNDTIILGDMNAHNTCWNCPDTNSQGDLLYEVMYDEHFICINVDTLSRSGSHGQRDTNLDLMFGSPGIVDRVSYKQLEDVWDSDHAPISFSFDVPSLPYRKITNRLSTKRTDWIRYGALVDREIASSMLQQREFFRDDLQKYYGRFVDILRNSVAVASGRRTSGGTSRLVTSPSKTKISHKWWDSECEEVIRMRRTKFAQWKKTKSLHDFFEYKRAVAAARRTTRAKKRASFDRFCSEINRFTSPSYVWNTIRILKNARSNLDWHPWPTKNREEVIRASIDNLAPPTVPTEPLDDECGALDDELDAPFVAEELERAIEMIGRDSAPGLDGVDYGMIRHLSVSARICLLELFNVVWSSGAIPTDWLEYQVIFIDKVGRERVRPISLSSCIGKVMERMINERLIFWAERDEKYSPTQNGFRRGKSCADNLARIVSDIKSALCDGEYTLAAFLDVSAAYDNVDYRIMVDKLIAQDCPSGIARFVGRWLYYRKQAVDLVTERLRSLGLDLEPKKTVLVEFSRSGFVDGGMNIRVNGCEVPNRNGARFLGIWLDNRLKFDRQVQEVRGKVNRANSVMRYLCRVSKGVEVNTAHMLYKSLVRSVTDYGNFIYFPRDSATQLKLERAQYMGIRTALGYRNSTPNNVIVAEAKVRLLRDRATLLGRNFVHKAMAYNRNGLCDKFQRLLDSECWARFRQPMYRFSLLSEIWRKSLPLRTYIGETRGPEIFGGSFKAQTFVPKINLTIGRDRKERKFSDQELMRRVRSEYGLLQNSEIIFTDGSFDEESRSTGAGIVICDRDIAYKISLPYMCSSYTAEVFAIRSALMVMKQQCNCRDIVILSDCKSALLAIKNNHLNVHKNKYVTETRILIYDLETVHNKNVILVWIPAHVGIEGNEMADGLAKEAANEEADPSIGVPVGDLMAAVRRETWNATQAAIVCDSAHKGTYYFEEFYERESTRPWFHKVNANRYFVTLINRLRANHFNLGVSLKRKGYVDSERCDCGHEIEDLPHLLNNCHKYDDARIELDRDLRAAGFLEEIDINRLIRAKNWDILYIIFTFLKKIDKVI
ncbi:uncharacterized protein [Temnothorax nylanderi]|uniref:uncharacterized protein n=1 Tax=Temnothorax nylanderi TaxID=102681 RepID=UPI003A8B4FC2